MNPDTPARHRRDVTIDLVRGFAVIAMMCAHAIFFFHTDADPVLRIIERSANTVVFTVFVFISGAAAAFFLMSPVSETTRRMRIIRHTVLLYACYAIVAVAAILTTKPFGGWHAVGLSIGGALTLVHPPNFTEFFIPLLWYSATLLALGRIYRYMSRHAGLIAAAAVCLYGTGTLLYAAKPPFVPAVVMAAFAGGTDLLLFPILQYWGIYLIGLWWGRRRHDAVPTPVSRSPELYLMATAYAVSLVSTAITGQWDIPILDPLNRWPPSIGFLSSGLATALGLSLIIPAVWELPALRHTVSFVSYCGRDALDLWIVHILLLFAYRLMWGTTYSSPLAVMGLTGVLFAGTLVLSSPGFVAPFSVFRLRPVADPAPGSHRFRLKKRYLAAVSVVFLLTVVNVNSKPKESTLGGIVKTNPLTVKKKLPENTRLTLAANRTWLLTGGPVTPPLELTIRLTDDATATPIAISKDDTLAVSVNGRTVRISPGYLSDGSVRVSLAPTLFTPGTARLTATLSTGFRTITSTHTEVKVSAPLLVSWSYDWEGWDASDTAMDQIAQLSKRYGSVPFTHFVSPRTFMDSAVPPARQTAIRDFLQTRVRLSGDEVALHMHMHYDLVRAAGVTPRSSHAWGYRSAEGYDIPTVEYPKEEFAMILAWGISKLGQEGFPMPAGYRAGGWFANGDILETLANAGLLYDASGRSKPTSGAFASIPWNLPRGAQPYMPSAGNQNVSGPDALPIMEIPNNGASTFESGAATIVGEFNRLYPGGTLARPVVFSGVSHPQFADREFPKLPEIFAALDRVSFADDAGPVIYVTMSTIRNVFISAQ